MMTGKLDDKLDDKASIKFTNYAINNTTWGSAFIFCLPNRVTNRWPPGSFQIFFSSYLRQNILFLLFPPTNFEQDWVLYTAICFHIMKKKTPGLVELNLQWELYLFTYLFSSTGLWWLLALWTWFNYCLTKKSYWVKKPSLIE